MSLTSWRQDQLLVLVLAGVLSLGAGFVGGYAVRAAKDIPRVAVAQACGARRAVSGDKSYERLWAEGEASDPPPATLPDEAISADERALREEFPMDGLQARAADDYEPPAHEPRQP